MKILKKIIIAIFIVPIFSLTVVGNEILDLYKYLHANPELSWQEYKTSDLLAEKMEELGFSVTKGFAKTGVVSIYKNGKGPVLMIRADMDGLPVQEKTGLKYASQVRSLYTDKSEVYVMHACGHDVHMAVAIGTAKELLRNKNKWSGTLMVIFQPAEERGQGSARMLEEGLFEKFPRPDYNLALHVGSTLPAGTVAYHKGYAMANVDMADITIFGVGGHGAYPHTTKDPIVLASKIVLALQTIVSREIDPLNPAVVTVGSIHGGFKHNIISDEVKLQLTLRSYTDEVREKIISKIKRIIRGEAISMGIPEDKMPTLKLRDEFTPALYNTPEFVDIVIKHIKNSIGENNVFETPPVMGGEDFGRFGRVEPKIPTFLFWIGGPSLLDWEKSEKGEISIPGNHSPLFAPDPEPTLKTGVSAMTAAAIGVFNEPR
ncbi:MAG: peptidase M20 [Rhodobiaceae bacterium]|jgi:hippurate hydrolase|nr:peptidase M20 [Rhodobiaceae bacterium]|tara:strand:+ start:7042 stop:8334 length:1293 start_codon:yes stop_codon:yes gene_type:complete